MVAVRFVVGALVAALAVAAGAGDALASKRLYLNVKGVNLTEGQGLETEFGVSTPTGGCGFAEDGATLVRNNSATDVIRVGSNPGIKYCEFEEQHLIEVPPHPAFTIQLTARGKITIKAKGKFVFFARSSDQQEECIYETRRFVGSFTPGTTLNRSSKPIAGELKRKRNTGGPACPTSFHSEGGLGYLTTYLGIDMDPPEYVETEVR